MYININSNINLDAENRIRIVWSWRNAVKTHNVNIFYKNSNRLEENDEEEKEPINIELTDQKQILIMMKMLLTLNDQI